MGMTIIYLQENGHPEDKDRVYKYTIHWFDSLDGCYGYKRTTFSTKKEAIGFLKKKKIEERKKFGKSVCFITRGTTTRRYFRKDVEVEYVIKKGGRR